MKKIIEALKMLELQKNLIKSQAVEQREILDIILDGNQRAAAAVANIKGIADGKEPKQSSPLSTVAATMGDAAAAVLSETKNQIFDAIKSQGASPITHILKDLAMSIAPPIAPIFNAKSELSKNPQKEAYAKLSEARADLDKMYSEDAFFGKKDIQPIMEKLYDLHLILWNMVK